MLSTLDFTGSGSDYSTRPPSIFLRAQPWKVCVVQCCRREDNITAVQSNLDFPDLEYMDLFPWSRFFHDYEY